jgi:hypothetical protein
LEARGASNQMTRQWAGAHGRTGVSPVNWNIFETRNGLDQATRQWVWGTQYVDEVLFMDVNGSPGLHGPGAVPCYGATHQR